MSRSRVPERLQVCQGGVLRLFGSKGAPPTGSARAADGKVSWTYLRKPAGPCQFGPNSGAGSPVEDCVGTQIGEKRISLSDKVDWQKGDWIVIATTSFSPFETEFAKIDLIDSAAAIRRTISRLGLLAAAPHRGRT